MFINCLIENPGFDSQTKETLNTPKTRFGSTCDLPSSMIEYILKSSILDRAVEMANSKLTREMASKLRNADRKQILGIPKLDDANEAGGRHSHRCTLILTEGDSAKALCTAGLAVKDRDYFGVFPLRGKPLNVRDASLKKVMACAEFQAVSKIMGLDIRQKYTSSEGLRYGHLMIMSDQDHDGSHIKGLIINMIHNYWPDLLKVPGFLQQFITPIVKARKKGRGAGAEEGTISFFSMPDYFEWKNAIGDGIKNYELRYYKGLGTSGAKEGREYFENIDRHRLDFVHENEQDDNHIIMAFSKDKVDERKQWITHFKANTNLNETMNYNVSTVTYTDFVNKELILFSVADCERSIPSVVDGLKPGQRKIIFSSFKRNLVRSIKVVQLAGYVSEHAAYHHGEQSLVQTIVGLAQDYVGANNLPLLQQDGQFGTRLQGGRIMPQDVTSLHASPTLHASFITPQMTLLWNTRTMMVSRLNRSTMSQ
ncbi:DNA gyrase B Toprim domain [Trypanosoma vivax]|nr:DNA gyrase B Toprim domain [Trypanosoma vivax]